MKKTIAQQAEFVMEIPDSIEPPPPMHVIVAQWNGRGPSHGSWKVFSKPEFFSKTATEKFANNLKPEWKRRRIYKLS